MASYKWADIASSESCASFGRTTMMLLERRERYNGIYKNYVDPSCANKFDSLHGNVKSAHYMLMSNDSYIDKNSIPELHDSKLNLNMKLKNVQLNNLSNEDKELLVDDESLTPLLNFDENVDDKNPKSFANFLTNSNDDKSRPKSANTPSNASKPAHFNKGLGAPMERLTPSNSTSSDLKKRREEAKGAPDATPREAKLGPEPNEKRSNSTSSNYYDDETNKIMNPTKKFKEGMKMTKSQKEEISKVLLNELTKAARPKVVEDTSTRVYSRLKDIAIGKATKGYQNYIRMVPRDERGPDDPQTPNSKNISASKFRAIYRTWRTLLHKYDDAN